LRCARHRLRTNLPASKKDQHTDRSRRRQHVGIKEVGNGIWTVSFMRYDFGYIDLEQGTLQPPDNPFGPRLMARVGVGLEDRSRRR
jgi:hypothetical protein